MKNEQSYISGKFLECLKEVLSDEMGVVFLERFLGRLPVIERMLLMEDNLGEKKIDPKHISVIFAALDLADLPPSFAKILGIGCITRLCQRISCKNISMSELLKLLSDYMYPFSYEIKSAAYGYTFILKKRPIYLPLFCTFLEGILLAITKISGHNYVSVVEKECGLIKEEEPACIFEINTYEENYDL